MPYVVHMIERLQDGQDECARVVDTIDEALSWINCHQDDSNRHNRSFRVFGIGREIPIKWVDAEIPQPAVKTRQYIEAKASNAWRNSWSSASIARDEDS